MIYYHIFSTIKIFMILNFRFSLKYQYIFFSSNENEVHSDVSENENTQMTLKNEKIRW